MKWLNDEMVDHLRGVSTLPDLSGTPYRILRSLGTGGMATVYLAEDAKLSRQVALKVMDVPAPSEQMASRMQAEARIIAQLEHPGIVPIHDVGILPDGRVFYVMKYVQGDNLTNHSQKAGSVPERLRVYLKVCEAVAFAHAHGVIHRDLKPANIMVGAFGEVLVMDWGVAKVLPKGDEGTQIAADPYLKVEEGKATINEMRLQASNEITPGPFVQTQSGTVLGTPSYMAPEQALGQTSSHNQLTDVYALGAILYFLLTHRHPHEGASIGQIRESFLRKQILRPRDVASHIPRPLEAVCMKSLAIDPQDRYAKVEDLKADIELYLSDMPVSAYRENVFEKAGRWSNRYRFVILLLFAYMFVRFLLFFLVRH